MVISHIPHKMPSYFKRNYYHTGRVTCSSELLKGSQVLKDNPHCFYSIVFQGYDSVNIWEYLGVIDLPSGELVDFLGMDQGFSTEKGGNPSQ